MIPSPRRTVSTPTAPTTWPDIDDDDGWQDMPVVRSDDNPFGLDTDDQKRYHYRPPARLDASTSSPSSTPIIGSTSNATGAHLEVDADTLLTESWRDKIAQDESEYTRLRLDEDEESEEVHMRTRYLFNEEKAMTPLSQMQATKELLTEGQRIAYVGLCHLIARRMVRDAGRGWEGVKVKGKGKGKEVPVVESANVWMMKIMARLYQHMELEREEQRMIESLAEHGVDPRDLVPALMTTHTVKNPEFDPVAKKKAEMAAEKIDEENSDTETEVPPPPYQEKADEHIDDPSSPSSIDPTTIPLPATSPEPSSPSPVSHIGKSIDPFGDDSDAISIPSASSSIPPTTFSRLSISDPDPGTDDEGDIGTSLSTSRPQGQSSTYKVEESTEVKGAMTEEQQPSELLHVSEHIEKPPQDNNNDPTEMVENAMPSLPGVSTHLSNTDETVTLDIRWTVLCDLFLVLIADSVYDARSRAFLERIATALGFGWLDAVRFENRVTNALEIEESLEKTEQKGIIEGRRKAALRKRYAMMGLAAVGGGLVIGLSAGLLAPIIGAGLGAALGTIGVTGTTGFLAGAGGAAVITTGGVLTGANIAGKGMARRTREVRRFEFKPLHNNKRVCCYVTVGGFMASKVDDVRLPFSVLDPVVGDVLSVLWEPEMMAEMGSALKILTSEILTQVGQQVLQATVMTALMSALQWPIILTKLGYLIDNPWSNALDRSRAAGLVLADTIIHRHAGVRPVSLIGFSLGARAIFYCLVELAKHKAFGLVQDVFVFGMTVTASRQTWLDVRSVVAGRFVNAFATNDWMLGYLFRATSGGLNTVAGLRPVETIPGLENVEVTDVITGHMSYRSCMPQLLAKVGFPVTADYFDEPADPEVDMSVQERTIVREAEEEEEANPTRKKILGIFPRQSKRSASGVKTPTTTSNSEKAAVAGGVVPIPSSPGDDDALPPREDEGDIGLASTSAARSQESLATEEDAEVRGIPKTAGFDFAAISRELGKDVKVDSLPTPSPSISISPIFQPTPERTGSAPPITSSFKSSFNFGFNAWTAPNSVSTDAKVAVPMRSAPPARPHPPELMANPFANNSTLDIKDTSGGSVTWDKKLSGVNGVDEQWAEKNPW
ncbi:hypothetical protein TREMEDRAFT_70052 [Tremella mesenterica DSM 1558]|uniref:uncharacterized protein n=1 Tax=Tremella mesenterica (strain ATCC 24925 / CBS 8224 / DSM 1558 / NBRC 9311 / NRRL Y-6157 / RJB 2259-6 / UBC 559-6) TaxID=578456 RepID=UPI00032D16E9|nr:uncharacterized protein TREMEDRAFT_70052 [Tremella mesenterica DSM 1558]EIW66799.1 hypothetical protein TREMEDRAFT_70052 [Tremella mesenterica DSM 1558]